MERTAALILLGVMFFLPTDLLSEESAVLIVTFFGLVAAGLLPAMSLVVGDTLTGARSVAKLLTLKQDIDDLLRQMLRLLAILMVGAIVTVLKLLEWPAFPDVIRGMQVPDWADEVPARVVQAAIFVCVLLSLNRTRVIAVAFKTVLNARFEMALADSRQRLEEKTPSSDDVASTFKTPEGFGAKVARR